MYSVVVVLAKESCTGDESLEGEECSGHPLEADNDQLRAIIEVDPPTTTGEAAEERSVDHSVVGWHLKQIGKVKKLDKWVPPELTKIKTIIFLKCSLLLSYETTKNHLSIGLW